MKEKMESPGLENVRRLLFTMQKPAPVGEVKVFIDEKGRLWANDWNVWLSWGGNLLFTITQDKALPVDPASGKPLKGFSLTKEQIIAVLNALRPFRNLSETAPDPETESEIRLAIRRKGNLLDFDEAMTFMPRELASVIESEGSAKLGAMSREHIKMIIEEAKANIDQIVADAETAWKIGSEEYPSFFDKQKYPSKLSAITAWIRGWHKNRILEQLVREGYAVISEEPTFKENKYSHPLSKIIAKYPMFFVQKQTLSGGFGIFVGPYCYRDSKTGKEVRLWEWGVEYDVG